MSMISASRFDSLERESALQLPIPGLLADIDTGDASLAMTDEFVGAPAAIRIRLLQQWIAGLRELKDAAVVDMFRLTARARPNLNIVDQVEAFRRDCADQGVTCPAELAVLLQRF